MAELNQISTGQLIQVVAALTEPTVKRDHPDTTQDAESWLKKHDTSLDVVCDELDRRATS